MFDRNLAKRFLNHINNLSFEEIEERAKNAEDCGMSRIIDEFPFRGNTLVNLKEDKVNYNDYRDKKCKYYRKESSQGITLFDRVVRKHSGKSYEELKQIILKKKAHHFATISALSILDAAKKGEDEDYVFINDKIQLREKTLTVKYEYNPYLFRKFYFDNINFFVGGELLMPERFEKFLQMVSKFGGFNLIIEDTYASIIGNNIVCYVSIEEDSPYYGLVLADYAEFYNKVSRCPLCFEIPKSYLGCKSALKELEYLGTNSAKKDLINDVYKPKHVTPFYWWDR